MIHINFNGGDVSSTGGVELLRAADDRLGLCKAASRLLPDPRSPTAITHQWEALFRQRIHGIAAGFAEMIGKSTATRSSVMMFLSYSTHSTKAYNRSFARFAIIRNKALT